MTIRIRFSPNELDIEGTHRDFAELQARIDKLLSSPEATELQVVCDTQFDPAPYDQNCAFLRLKIGSGPNQFNVVGATIEILGSRDALKNLGDNFPESGYSNGTIRYHHHYDRISFPEYVSSCSPWVTLSVRREKLARD